VTRRLYIVAVLLLVTGAARARLSAPEPVHQPHALRAFPTIIAGCAGRDVAIDPAVVQSSGVDDHLSRVYDASSGAMTLYVAYYRSQRAGSAIHSPLNCLPGNGWEPLSRQRIVVHDAPRQLTAAINKVIIRKGLDQHLVLYWYQSTNRITASEYSGKAFLVSDALRSRRTDVALVRVTAPIQTLGQTGEANAMAVARPFAEAVLHAVHNHLFGP
jgi:EpsI family protein